MKKAVQYLIKILSPVVVIAAAVSILSTYAVYKEYGGTIHVQPESSAALSTKLDALSLPYGKTGETDYDCFESRPELMPIIAEICRELGIESEHIYIHAHTRLFYSIILSFSAVCICFTAAGFASEKRLMRMILFTAAFLTASGCLIWLGLLPLSADFMNI